MRDYWPIILGLGVCVWVGGEFHINRLRKRADAALADLLRRMSEDITQLRRDVDAIRGGGNAHDV